MSSLTVKQGAIVDLVIEGHSNVNGASMADTGTLVSTSNDETVVKSPGTIPIPAGGAQSITFPGLTIVGPGSSDLHEVYTDKDGNIFEDTVTLIVEVVLPGLLRITATLVERTA